MKTKEKKVNSIWNRLGQLCYFLSFLLHSSNWMGSVLYTKTSIPRLSGVPHKNCYNPFESLNLFMLKNQQNVFKMNKLFFCKIKFKLFVLLQKKEKFFVNNKISTWIRLVCKKTTFLIIYDLHHSTNTQTEILYGVRLFFRLIIKQTYCSKNRFFFTHYVRSLFFTIKHTHTHSQEFFFAVLFIIKEITFLSSMADFQFNTWMLE